MTFLNRGQFSGPNNIVIFVFVTIIRMETLQSKRFQFSIENSLRRGFSFNESRILSLFNCEHAWTFQKKQIAIYLFATIHLFISMEFTHIYEVMHTIIFVKCCLLD